MKLLLVLNLLFISFVYAETAYKTFDAEGNIIFSDVASDGAEMIELQEAQTVDTPEVTRRYRPTTKLEPKKKEYSKLVILSPENDITIHNNEGNISIAVEIKPLLFGGDSLVLFMDGKETSSGTSSQFSLSNVERGTHTIDVAVRNEKGKFIKRSEKLVLHLRKASVLFKKPTIADTTTSEKTESVPVSTDTPLL
ncbi:MAG TPA: hypothetical protein EYQ42_10820 [Thiotrichaceae bacterium]|jgi:hypothetical protein|nr:hypothetical protein [Thiotrichaceae bacterium]HIM08920.1 hypothetical protein [Gammaproteobacteria bacterium]